MYFLNVINEAIWGKNLEAVATDFESFGSSVHLLLIETDIFRTFRTTNIHSRTITIQATELLITLVLELEPVCLCQCAFIQVATYVCFLEHNRPTICKIFCREAQCLSDISSWWRWEKCLDFLHQVTAYICSVFVTCIVAFYWQRKQDTKYVKVSK